MRFVRTNCPNCEKPIQVDTKENGGTCPYCGKDYLTETVLKDVQYEKPSKMEIKEESFKNKDCQSTKKKSLIVDRVMYNESLHSVVWSSQQNLFNCISDIEILSENDNKVIYRDVVSNHEYRIPNQKIDRYFKARVRIAEKKSEEYDDSIFGPWAYSTKFFVPKSESKTDIHNDTNKNAATLDCTPKRKKKKLSIIKFILSIAFIIGLLFIIFNIANKTINEFLQDQVIEHEIETITTYNETEIEIKETTDNETSSPLLETTKEKLVNDEEYSPIQSLASNENKEQGPEPLGINGNWTYDYELRRDCLVITEILEDGNAYNQGLIPGDIILSIDNYAIKSQDNLTDVMNNHYIGEPFVFVIFRDDSHLTITINIK